MNQYAAIVKIFFKRLFYSDLSKYFKCDNYLMIITNVLLKNQFILNTA